MRTRAGLSWTGAVSWAGAASVGGAGAGAGAASATGAVSGAHGRSGAGAAVRVVPGASPGPAVPVAAHRGRPRSVAVAWGSAAEYGT
ncbi:hypothetical protein E4099_13600, partial [Streptomyces palmae]